LAPPVAAPPVALAPPVAAPPAAFVPLPPDDFVPPVLALTPPVAAALPSSPLSLLLQPTIIMPATALTLRKVIADRIAQAILPLLNTYVNFQASRQHYCRGGLHPMGNPQIAETNISLDAGPCHKKRQ
jgi:hypothetical protein